jgi:hypothetical protein
VVAALAANLPVPRHHGERRLECRQDLAEAAGAVDPAARLVPSIQRYFCPSSGRSSWWSRLMRSPPRPWHPGTP